MLSAAGGRTPEVWNPSYVNPHHGSLVNGNGRESPAEEGNPAPQHGVVAATSCGCPWASLQATTEGGPTSLPAGAITLESVRPGNNTCAGPMNAQLIAGMMGTRYEEPPRPEFCSRRISAPP